MDWLVNCRNDPSLIYKSCLFLYFVRIRFKVELTTSNSSQSYTAPLWYSHEDPSTLSSLSKRTNSDRYKRQRKTDPRTYVNRWERGNTLTLLTHWLIVDLLFDMCLNGVVYLVQYDDVINSIWTCPFIHSGILVIFENIFSLQVPFNKRCLDQVISTPEVITLSKESKEPSR